MIIASVLPGKLAGSCCSSVGDKSSLRPVLDELCVWQHATMHGDVDPGRQCLCGRKGDAHVEGGIGAMDAVGNHRAGQDDGLARCGGLDLPGGCAHGVGAVGDQDALGRRGGDGGGDVHSLFIGDFQAVLAQDLAHWQLNAGRGKNFCNHGRPDVEIAGRWVVTLVDGAASSDQVQGV